MNIEKIIISKLRLWMESEGWDERVETCELGISRHGHFGEWPWKG